MDRVYQSFVSGAAKHPLRGVQAAFIQRKPEPERVCTRTRESAVCYSDNQLGNFRDPDPNYVQERSDAHLEAQAERQIVESGLEFGVRLIHPSSVGTIATVSESFSKIKNYVDHRLPTEESSAR